MQPALRHLLWLIGPLALVLAPQASKLPIWVSLAWLVSALLSLYGAAVKRQPFGRVLRTLLTLTGVAGVMAQYGTVIGPTGGMALLVFLSGVKLLEVNSARDRIGLLFVGCFLLVAHFLDAQSMVTAAYMVVAALALVAGLIANQTPASDLASAGRRVLALAGSMLLQALPLALLLFVLFPRLQGPLWGLPQQTAARSGLSDRMRPGDISQLIQSDELAFRAEFADAKPDYRQLYWRGPVFWDFDGRTWQTTQPLAPSAPAGIGDGQPLRYLLTLEPHRQRWLFLLGLPASLPATLPTLPASLGPDLQWLAKDPVTQRLRYQVDAYLSYRLDLSLGPAARARALALPPGIDPRARELAGAWRRNPRADAAIVEQALALFRDQPFFYTLNPPLLGEAAVDDFLFSTRRGFCEHYASAFVFLMRAAGIPARVVTGYQGGELNQLGNYWIVRGRDAHAWAEVWLAGRGWERVDPTAAVAPSRVESGVSAALPIGEHPGGLMTLDAAWLRPLRLGWDLVNNQWNQWVLGYDQERQRQFLSRLNPLLANWQGMVWALAVGAALILLGVAALLLLPRLAHAKRDPVAREYARFCRALARRGIAHGAAEAPEDFARRAAKLRPDLAGEIGLITRLYLDQRYGRAGTDSMQALRDAVGRFRPARRGTA